MKLFKLLMVLAGFSLFFSGCASSVGARNASFDAVVSGRFEVSESPKLERHANAVHMLYFNPQNQLLLRHEDGSELVLGVDREDEVRQSHAVLHSDGTALLAAWRPKLIKAQDGIGRNGDKFVYLRSSLDGGKTFGTVQRLSQGGGAFAPQIVSNGTGDVYVAYTDERNGGLDTYLNVSHDHGASWKTKDIKVNDAEPQAPALNPSLVASGPWLHVAWMTRYADDQFKIVVRSSADRGETWADPVVAYSSPAQPTTPVLVKTTQGLMLCWAEAEAARCSSSLDQNKTWSRNVALEESSGTQGVYLSTDIKGRAHILLAKKPVGEGMRLNLFHAVSDDGLVFSKLQRLNGGAAYAFGSILPVLSHGDDGSVLAAWVDMRYVRPVIAANYSEDGGRSWLPDAFVLAGKTRNYHFFPTVSYASSGTYAVAWQESESRTIPTSVVGSRQYRAGTVGVTMPTPDVARLKERVDSFWKLREEDKWAQAYDYLDPFFREANSRSNYVKTQGLVKYYEHRMAGEPQINGSIAIVPVAFVSEVPEIVIQGKSLQVPKKEIEVPHEWVWVDGEWYQVFRDLMNGSTLME